MDSIPNFNPAVSDGGRRGAGAWNRGIDSRFEWVASSPSPAEVEALERRFPEVIQVPAQLLEDVTSEWRLKAVIARSLSRWVPTEAIVREFRRAGISGDVESVSLAHRHYLFRFSDPSAKDIALARPWMANGQLIAMEEWRPQFVPSEGSLASALFWIRLPSLPIEYWTKEIIGSIISVAGVFQFIDDATRERKRGGFARACVRVDLSKPL